MISIANLILVEPHDAYWRCAGRMEDYISGIAGVGSTECRVRSGKLGRSSSGRPQASESIFRSRLGKVYRIHYRQMSRIQHTSNYIRFSRNSLSPTKSPTNGPDLAPGGEMVVTICLLTKEARASGSQYSGGLISGGQEPTPSLPNRAEARFFEGSGATSESSGGRWMYVGT